MSWPVILIVSGYALQGLPRYANVGKRINFCGWCLAGLQIAVIALQFGVFYAMS